MTLGYVEYSVLEKQFVIPQVTKREKIGENCLQRSLVLKHCHTGLWPCHFPSRSLTQIQDLSFFLHLFYLLLQPSSLQPSLQLKISLARHRGPCQAPGGCWQSLWQERSCQLRTLLPSPGSTASCWEADQGSISVQKNSPDLQGCPGECQGVTLRQFTCSASPLPLACIFCSTEPVLMHVSCTLMFQAVRSQIHLGKNPCLITYNFYRNKQKQLRIGLSLVFS